MNDITAMEHIPYERGSFYIVDRGYNSFGDLYRIHRLEFTFLTNNLSLTANEIALLYKNRWQSTPSRERSRACSNFAEARRRKPKVN
jgi:hypothetical protein